MREKESKTNEKKKKTDMREKRTRETQKIRGKRKIEGRKIQIREK